MSSSPIARLADPAVQAFLFAHETADETAWLLQGRPLAGMPAALMAQQLAARRKAKEKLPLFYQTPGIVYPALVNLEQTSSEATAQFKQLVIGRALDQPAGTAADLTGGWGVDSFFLAKSAAHFFYAEPDAQLVQLAAHNHALLGQKNIAYQTAALPNSLIALPHDLDFIFLDPSRRAGSQKTVRLENCAPDVVSLLPEMWKKTHTVLIKASPLLDLHQAQSRLPHVSHVYVVAVENECKEVLLLCRHGYRGRVTVCATMLNSGRPDFAFTPEEEQRAESRFSEPLAYVYEPAAAILKAGGFRLVGQRFGLKKLHPNTHLYTSHELVAHFPGRIFEINHGARAAHLPEGRANVVVRNFPTPAQALRNRLGLADGGEHYVLAFTGPAGRHVLVARRLQ
jgi:hypothetical protein